jgi:oxygen-dependent protoporphyrinogen oxidase
MSATGAPVGATVVAGGGITGLVAALELAAGGQEVTLLESSARLGGKIVSATWRGRPLDLGPDAFIARNPAAFDLCRRAGLGSELIVPSATTAAVWARDRLRPFPTGLALGVPVDLVALARSGIVGPAAVARAAFDLLLPGPDLAGLIERARAGEGDPTIAEVVAPRLGRQVLANLVDPLLGGINAGDSAALSFAAAAPTLASRLNGASLIRSLRPAGPPARRGTDGETAPPAGVAPSTADGAASHRRGNAVPAASGPGRPAVFFGLERGLASLVDALADACRAAGVTIRLGTRLQHVRRGDGGAAGYVLELAGAPRVAADRLVLAVPANAAAGVLAPLDATLSGELAAIPYAGVVLVTAAFRTDEVDLGLAGSGVLLPRADTRQVTAFTVVSAKWPRSAAPGEVVVRASLGRHGHGDVLELDDDAVAAVATAEARSVLGLHARPLDVLVQRWPASFPQYVRGHLARLARIERLVSDHPGLALAGAAYRGIGIPACVEDGMRAASQLRAAGALAR